MSVSAGDTPQQWSPSACALLHQCLHQLPPSERLPAAIRQDLDSLVAAHVLPMVCAPVVDGDLVGFALQSLRHYATHAALWSLAYRDDASGAQAYLPADSVRCTR